MMVALLAGGLALAESGHERSLAIFPPQKLPVRFDHAQHLKAGADCTSCRNRGAGMAANTHVPPFVGMVPTLPYGRKIQR